VTKKVWLLGALAALVAVPAASVAIAAVVINPDDYKPQLIDAVMDATGRVLSLNGPLRVSWSLWPTLQVNGASLANAPGGSRPDMARAERIEARISLPALLFHRLEILQLRLIGPNVLFEVANGQSNWILGPPSGIGDGDGSSFRLRIREITVQNGMVTWRLPARTKVVGLRSLDLRHPRDGGPIELSGMFVYGDNQPFALKASAEPTAGPRDPWRAGIDFSAYDTTAHAQGTMSLAGDYDLDIAARSGSLDKLNALLPEMDLPALHGAVLSAHVTNNRLLGSLPVLGPARLSFDDADLGGAVPGLTLLRTEISLPEAGGNATVGARGRFADQPLTITGTFGVPRQPDERGGAKFDLTAKAGSAGGLSLAGMLRFAALRFDGLDAAASLRVAALAPLRPMLTASLPALSDLRFDGQITVPADAGSARFANAKLTTQAGDIAGDGEIGFRAGALTAQGKLSSSRFDFDVLLRAFDADPSAPAAPSRAGRVFPETPLPWIATKGPAIDIAATIGAATFQRQTWRDATVTLRLRPGQQAASVHVTMPEGKLDLSMTADAAAPGMPASLFVQAPSVPLALLARYAGLPGAASGSARIEAQFHGSGRTAHDLAASLDGPFSMTVVRGQLSNAALIKLAAGLLTPLGINVPAEGETALRCLGLIGAASNGVARLRTIALESTYLSMNAVGQVDLGNETVALKLHPLAQVGGSPVAVPVVVEGPFHAITGRLDASGLDKIGLLIDGWFGGDAPETCTDAGLVPAKPPGDGPGRPQGK
jgi:AsmA protein